MRIRPAVRRTRSALSTTAIDSRAIQRAAHIRQSRGRACTVESAAERMNNAFGTGRRNREDYASPITGSVRSAPVRRSVKRATHVDETRTRASAIGWTLEAEDNTLSAGGRHFENRAAAHDVANARSSLCSCSVESARDGDERGLRIRSVCAALEAVKHVLFLARRRDGEDSSTAAGGSAQAVRAASALARRAI